MFCTGNIKELVHCQKAPRALFHEAELAVRSEVVLLSGHGFRVSRLGIGMGPAVSVQILYEKAIRRKFLVMKVTTQQVLY